MSGRFTVRPGTVDDEEKLHRFNERLRNGGRKEQISVSSRVLNGPDDPPAPPPVYRRIVIADDGSEVRAAVMLVHQKLSVNGETCPFCWVNMPLSEGLIDRKYAMAIVQMMKSLTRMGPLLLSLGVGAMDETWARFAVSMGWKHAAVPFFFYPVHVSAVLRELRMLKRKAPVKVATQLIRTLGGGALASGVLAVRRKVMARGRASQAMIVPEFDTWADPVWTTARPDYAVAAWRNSEALNAMYPRDDQRFRRLRVKAKDGCDLGWLVVAVARMENNHHFGNLKVGVVVDGLATAPCATELLSVGLEYLVGEGVDLVVANWSHQIWIDASKQLGFFSGPSNYFLFVAPGEHPLLTADAPLSKMHLTRGDSDGMVSFRKKRQHAAKELAVS